MTRNLYRRFDIPDVGYTIDDAKNIVDKLREDVERSELMRYAKSFKIHNPQKLDYSVKPFIEGNQFVGYRYQINDKKYLIRLQTPLPKSKKLSISGLDIDRFIKEQLPTSYRDPQAKLDDNVFFFGIPGPIYFLPFGEPGEYTHELGDPDLKDRTLFCRYERGDGGVLYRHGLAMILQKDSTYGIYLSYEWGILRQIIVPGSERLLFCANYDQYGYTTTILFNFEISLTSEDVTYLYTLNKGQLDGPAFCYKQRSGDNYLLTRMRSGVYAESFSDTDNVNIAGTISPFNLLPLPVLWSKLADSVESFPYTYKSEIMMMDIVLYDKTSLSYRLPNDTKEGPEILIPDQQIINWHGLDKYDDSETVKILDTLKQSFPKPLAAIIRDYYYGDRYYMYLKMILREFGTTIQADNKEKIQDILNTW